MVKRLAAVTAAVAGIVSPATAYAHESGATLLTLNLADDAVEFVAQAPLFELETVIGVELTDEPEGAIAANRQTLVELFESGVEITGGDGIGWGIEVDEVGVAELDGIEQLRVGFTATPPAGSNPLSFDLEYHVLTDQIYTHDVYVATVDADGRAAEAVGIINRFHPDLTVSLVGLDPAGAFLPMIGVGFTHFREGTDHLLFLVLVSLGAAGLGIGARRSLTSLAGLTAAFTVGHSVSLALASLGLVDLPTRLIETAIAGTVALTAIHVVRPLVGRRVEPLITLVFGLVHGFGFAGTLGELGVSGVDILVPTAGFNLGLELAQLAVLALMAVPLWCLARSRVARFLVAGSGAALAAAWIMERGFGIPSPLDPAVTVLVGTPERLAAVLASAGLLLLAYRGMERRSDSQRSS